MKLKCGFWRDQHGNTEDVNVVGHPTSNVGTFIGVGMAVAGVCLAAASGWVSGCNDTMNEASDAAERLNEKLHSVD